MLNPKPRQCLCLQVNFSAEQRAVEIYQSCDDANEKVVAVFLKLEDRTRDVKKPLEFFTI